MESPFGYYGRLSKCFSLTYISLVRAGEASGKLDRSFKRLAETLEKQRTFKSKIRGAMLLSDHNFNSNA